MLRLILYPAMTKMIRSPQSLSYVLLLALAPLKQANPIQSVSPSYFVLTAPYEPTSNSSNPASKVGVHSQHSRMVQWDDDLQEWSTGQKIREKSRATKIVATRLMGVLVASQPLFHL